MKRFPTFLVCIACACITRAQNATYLHIPAPRGTRVAAARWAVNEAHLLGYEGVVIPVGTDQIQDPLKTDWSGFTSTVNDALNDGLRVHLRLLQNVPIRAYANGVPIGPSAWVTRYNNGVSWSTPYRPPLNVCPQIAKLVWQRATDILYDACVSHHLSVARYASEELANEPGIRGAGGAYSGDSFANAIWPAGLEGSIEPYFWKMLRTLRYSFSARGIPTYAATLEGTAGSVGQTEIDCVVGEDARRVSDGCTGWGFNRYATVPSSTPALAASSWSSRASTQVPRMRRNPFIGSKPLFLTEFGMKNSALLMTGLSSSVSAADYRSAVLQASRSLSGVVGCGLFLSISTNTLASGYQLFNVDGTAVGGLVGPSLVASK